MLNKIMDFMDTETSMVILIENIEDGVVLASVLQHVGLDRLSYEIYKDTITAYIIEIRMPYNRYLKTMQGLRKFGYNLKSESKADIFNRLIKIES